MIAKLSLEEDAVNLHRMLKGKIEIHNRVSIDRPHKEGKNDTLDLIYTPGVAYVAKKISADKELAYEYTSKWETSPLYVTEPEVARIGRHWSGGSTSCYGRKICIIQNFRRYQCLSIMYRY